MRRPAAAGLQGHDEPVRVARVHPDAPALIADEGGTVAVPHLAALHLHVLPGALHPVGEHALLAIAVVVALLLLMQLTQLTRLGRQLQCLVAASGGAEIVDAGGVGGESHVRHPRLLVFLEQLQRERRGRNLFLVCTVHYQGLRTICVGEEKEGLFTFFPQRSHPFFSFFYPEQRGRQVITVLSTERVRVGCL